MIFVCTSLPLSIGRTFPNVVTELYEVYIHSHSGINTCFWMPGGGADITNNDFENFVMYPIRWCLKNYKTKWPIQK